ncbi:MAG: Membrane fusion component of MSF-type tripartite multidrug efflux system [Pseudolabrys sp.]|jgi:membrane fusion protein (multidrug efflux system)|nr:Membrane fusion component of MSF-type tripartite multidrug efflux system [Pseudolabrys sp.]
MSDNVVKIVPEAKRTGEGTPPADAKTAAAAQPGGRRKLRTLLLVVIPLVLVVGGGLFYLLGGRYVSTDNAYVGAQKVLVTPDVSSKVQKILVKEGQHVKVGDELFELDPVPFRLALEQAEAKLGEARTQYLNDKTNLASLTQLTELVQKNVDVKRRDVERKMQLVERQAGAQADLDSAISDLVDAQLQAQSTKQQRDNTLNALKGDPNLPLEQFPAYAQAKAAYDDAKRNLDHTVLRAAIDGTATQVDNIQLGRYVTAGSPVFSIVDDAAPWVDANPKETDITYLRVGQKATISVDSFPDKTFTGTVQSVSPGTGAQFSILPPQNATGNWVKVVQRVPVRIVFDKGQDLHLLRAGMSVNVDIDTHHSRIPFFGQAQATPK